MERGLTSTRLMVALVLLSAIIAVLTWAHP